MPSASAKSSQPQTTVSSGDLMQEPIKNAVSVLDKKLRNLEKRKLKLTEYRKKADGGGELNQDQKDALENMALVDNSVATVKELQKNLTALDQEYSRLVKKEQKRAKQEKKDQAEAQSVNLTFKVIEVQGILGDLTEEVRPDFLQGSNGACTLTEDELASLDAFYELVNIASGEGDEKKLSVRVKVATDHLVNLVQGKEAAVIDDITYKTLLETINKIIECGYFDKDPESEEQPPVQEETQEPVAEEAPEFVEEESVTPEETTPTEEFSQTEFTQEAAPSPTETPNGVDLPPEVQQTPEDEKIDFLGESEISTANADQSPPSLNPVSPEFVPRTMQQTPEDSGWNDSGTSNVPNTANSDGWQTGGHQGGGGNRGRGGRGRGTGGRGRGRGGGGEYRGRQDGNYRGNYRGNRGGGDYRGGNRGGRGGPRGGRGGPRGGRGGERGGFGRPQGQQEQH